MQVVHAVAERDVVLDVRAVHVELIGIRENLGVVDPTSVMALAFLASGTVPSGATPVKRAARLEDYRRMRPRTASPKRRRDITASRLKCRNRH
jgi:hypothetical protein